MANLIKQDKFANAGLMLAHHLRRWSNVFAGTGRPNHCINISCTTDCIVAYVTTQSRDILKQVPKFPSSGNFKFRVFKFRELQVPKFQNNWKNVLDLKRFLQKSLLVGKTVWYSLLILSAVD